MRMGLYFSLCEIRHLLPSSLMYTSPLITKIPTSPTSTALHFPSFHLFYASPYIHRQGHVFRHSSQFKPILFDSSSIANMNLFSDINVVSRGSPSRIRMVLLISLGITTLPRSSILRTIPVAFILSEFPFLFKFGDFLNFYIYENLLKLQITALLVSAK